MDEGPTVFTRLHQALTDAAKEEREFATEVTEGDPDSEALYQAFDGALPRIGSRLSWSAE